MLTAAQMKYEAKLQFEDIASNDAPSFTDREWSVLLTNAQAKVVYEAYKKFDSDEESRVALQALIKRFGANNAEDALDRITIAADILPSAYKVTLPADYMYSIFEHAKTSKSQYVKVVQVPYDAYAVNIQNPYKKPSMSKIWRLIGYENNLILISPYQINDYICTYISRPEPIITAILTTPIEGTITTVNDCKLHANLHRRIVSVAVELAHAAVMDPNGYQLQRVESQRI